MADREEIGPNADDDDQIMADANGQPSMEQQMEDEMNIRLGDDAVPTNYNNQLSK